jgi:integrase/recombinase XerD
MIKRTKKARDIKTIYDEFQKFNQVKNLSEQTIQYYFWNLKPFFDYLLKSGISAIDTITSDTIDDFVLSQKNCNDNDITINTHMRAVRAFIYYAMGKGYLPTFKIHLLKQPEKIMETYSDGDIQKLIAKPDFKDCSFVEYRNWVLVHYFIETGNRLHSVINIKVSDLCIPERKILVHVTKNREEIATPLTKTLLNIIPPYIEAWGLTDDSYLFPSVTGLQLSENAAKQAIAKYNKDHGVNITSIHAFRHTFARNYIVTKGSSFKLQSLLGHKDMSMTRHYVHLFGEDLASDIDEHSIVERIKPVSKRFTKKSKKI